MLNTVLFGSYVLSCGAIIRNFVKMKQQDDMERDIKLYREYNYNDEKIKKEMFDKYHTAKCIILAKYFEDIDKEGADKVLFQKEVAFFNDMGPSRFITAKPSNKFTMVFDKSEKNPDLPLEVHFGNSKMDFFDIDTLKLDKDVS